ncbi:hypothetical protein [Shewanella sp.]|nr:hypothetical protein [Shewanella sp.]
MEKNVTQSNIERDWQKGGQSCKKKKAQRPAARNKSTHLKNK